MSNEESVEGAGDPDVEDAPDEVDVEDVEEDVAETGAEEAEPEGIQDGDFVRLAYTARTVEDDTLVDTTDVEVAEEEGIDTEDQVIEPRVIVVGAGHIFPAVEEDLVGKGEGDTGTVSVPAADAFGEYDPDQVRTVSADRIPEDDRYPGGHVDIDGQHGHVETIIGGRARVDFNHMLAGEDIEYDYEVLEVVEDRLERARGLLGMYVDVDLEMSIETDEEEEAIYDDEGEEEEGTETVEYETLYIEATPQLSMNQQWLFQKTQIASDVIERTGVDRVIVQEILDGAGGLGGLGGLGGMGGMGDVDVDDIDAEELVEDIDVDDVDAEELAEELGEEMDVDLDEPEE